MFSALCKFKVVPLVKVKDLDVEDALHIAEALSAGGLPVMELSFRRYSDSKAIRAISEKFPDFWIGAGGILSKDQLLRVVDAKAKFAMSPGVNPDTIREASRRNIIYAPGVCTPTDIEMIILNGSIDFQFFPAEQSGGIEMLKAIIEPFEHLPLEIYAKGSIPEDKITAYLKIPQVVAVGAEWIVDEATIRAKDWTKISESAKKARFIAEQG
ncbi:MAG: hypothetical protein A2020_01390 [Lentisphaerae bacterium GWF2_45_14]|nr:MAG: hypothetical protein A2020_01390 [Lentisphaerae bacterium GWF2_45_14]